VKEQDFKMQTAAGAFLTLNTFFLQQVLLLAETKDMNLLPPKLGKVRIPITRGRKDEVKPRNLGVSERKKIIKH